MEPIAERALLLYFILGPWALTNNVFVLFGSVFVLICLFTMSIPGGVATATFALFGTVLVRRRWSRLRTAPRPGFSSLLLVMGVPLVLAATFARAITAMLLSWSMNSAAYSVSSGVGIFAICLAYGFALWCRCGRLLAICGRTTRILFGWPGIILAWVGTRILRVEQQRAT